MSQIKKQNCLILIEHSNSHLARLKSALIRAHELKIKTIGIVPENCSNSITLDVPFEVFKTPLLSYEYLDNIIRPLSEKYNLIGINCPYGYFQSGNMYLPSAIIAELAQKYHLPHNNPDALYFANNKFLMREQLAKFNVPSVNYALVNSEDELEVKANEIGYPIVAKPAAGAASGFVSFIKNIDELKSFYRYYVENMSSSYHKLNFSYNYKQIKFDNTNQLLLEKAIHGNEYSVEVLCDNEDVFPLLMHEKIDVIQNKSCVLENIVFTPTISLSEKEKEEINNYTKLVCKTLGLKNCFCHFELRLSTDGPIILEVNPRMGGSRIKDNIETIYNISYEDILINQTIGKELKFIKNPDTPDFLSMSVIYPTTKGYLKSIDGLDKVEKLTNVINTNTYYKIGDFINGENEEVFLIDVWYSAKNEEEIINTDRFIRKNIILIF